MEGWEGKRDKGVVGVKETFSRWGLRLDKILPMCPLMIHSSVPLLEGSMDCLKLLSLLIQGGIGSVTPVRGVGGGGEGVATLHRDVEFDDCFAFYCGDTNVVRRMLDEMVYRGAFPDVVKSQADS
ncbi:hypothetical protein ACSQ67_014812 [Phaseolus vulgaris]